MKRVGVVFVAILLSVSVLLLASTIASSDVRAQEDEQASTQAILFTCIPVGRLEDGLSVERSNSSAGASTIHTRLDCAQALADLLSEGYSIADVEFFSGSQVLYTMVKQ